MWQCGHGVPFPVSAGTTPLLCMFRIKIEICERDNPKATHPAVLKSHGCTDNIGRRVNLTYCPPPLLSEASCHTDYRSNSCQTEGEEWVDLLCSK